MASYVQANKLHNARLIFADRYLAESFQIDIYDGEQFHILNDKVLQNLKSNDLLIWDSWHGPVDFGISEEQLMAIPSLEKIEEFQTQAGSLTVKYIVFRNRDGSN